jgi:hypothetical protein
MQMVMQVVAVLSVLVLLVTAVRRTTAPVAMPIRSRAAWMIVLGVFCVTVGWVVAGALLDAWGLSTQLLTLNWERAPGRAIALMSGCGTIGLVLAIGIATIAEEHARYMGLLGTEEPDQRAVPVDGRGETA